MPALPRERTRRPQMKKQPKKPAKLVLSRDTLSRLELEKVQGGALETNQRIVETDTPSECFC
jgi:hypothetical protein